MIDTMPPDDEGPDDDGLPTPPPNPDDGSKRRRGRKPACTTSLTDQVGAILLEGNSLLVAARILGFSPATFSRWRTIGMEQGYEDGVYAQFAQVVDASIAKYKRSTVREITSFGSLELRLELLGRQHPAEFGRYRGELGELKREVMACKKDRAELRELKEKFLAKLAELNARLSETTVD